MTQQQREAIAGMLRASPFDPAGDLREQRLLFEKMIAAAPVPADVVTTPGQLGGVPVIYVDIPGTTTDGVILYFHGGFFAIGSAATSVGLAAGLARKARMQVVTVDYRLAPEHPYPAAPDDAMTAYRALLDSGQDAARLALAGESAGAGLALVTLAAIGRAGLPPLLIQAGSHEVLLDDAIRLAARAASDDVAVTLDVTPGVPHVFQAFAAILDEGEAALTRAGAFLRAHTGTAAAQSAGRRG
jgi:epsilon-lactone hydrolase